MSLTSRAFVYVEGQVDSKAIAVGSLEDMGEEVIYYLLNNASYAFVQGMKRGMEKWKES